MSFFQYLKDTRSELHHVAWPTRAQTIVYTVIVVVLSVFVALYLGFFDFVFTSSLGKVVNVIPPRPNSGLDVTQIPVTASSSPATTTINVVK